MMYTWEAERIYRAPEKYSREEVREAAAFFLYDIPERWRRLGGKLRMDEAEALAEEAERKGTDLLRYLGEKELPRPQPRTVDVSESDPYIQQAQDGEVVFLGRYPFWTVYLHTGWNYDDIIQDTAESLRAVGYEGSELLRKIMEELELTCIEFDLKPDHGDGVPELWQTYCRYDPDTGNIREYGSERMWGPTVEDIRESVALILECRSED